VDVPVRGIELGLHRVGGPDVDAVPGEGGRDIDRRRVVDLPGYDRAPLPAEVVVVMPGTAPSW